MSIRTKRNSRRFIAAAAAVAVAASTFATTSGPAGAAPTVTVSRVSGDDRYATSIKISEATFPVAGSATHVILASGTSEVDGLAASALAGRRSAPVLLIPPTGAVSAALAAEITRLGATDVIIVGGNAAVAAAAETNLAAAGRTITRISGADRYETAANVATEGVGAANVGAYPTTTRKAVIIARGDNAADALAASGVAYAGKHPVLLTRSGSLDASAAAAITALGATQAVIMGGTAAVSDAVKTAIEALGVTTVRVSGADRAATATAFADIAVTAFGFTRAVPMLVSGTSFADALSAGPHSGTEKRAMLYASAPGQAGLPTATATYLSTNANSITTLVVIGGTAAVPAAVATAAQTEAQKAAMAAPTLVSFNSVKAPTALDEQAIYEFVFTGGIPATLTNPTATNFRLVTWDGNAYNAASTTRMSDTTIRASWTGALATVAAATAIAVARGAYTTTAGLASQASVQPLKAVNVSGFREALVTSVTAAASGSAATAFTVSMSNASVGAGSVDYEKIKFYLPDGTSIAGNAAGVTAATASASSLVIGIPNASASAVSSFSRIVLGEAAVKTTAGTNVDTKETATLLRPAASNLTVRPTVTGFTTGVAAATGAVTITVTYDRTVTIPASTPHTELVPLLLGGASGTAASAAIVNAVAGTGTQVIYTLNPSIDPKDLRGFHLLSGAAAWVDGAGDSLPQTFSVNQSFAAGETLGPRLTAVGALTPIADPMSATGKVSEYTMTLTFSEIVTLSATNSVKLAAVNTNGVPTVVTATAIAPLGTTASPLSTTVTVKVSAAAGVLALSNAVTILLGDGQVADRNGNTNYWPDAHAS